MDEKNKTKLNPVELYSICYTPKTINECTNKSPIIFLHGLLSSPYTWQVVKTMICNLTNRKGYAVALRNHSQSGYSDEHTVDLLVEDLRHFMLKENIPKAIMVGHSLGGRVVMAFALQKPEMVEALIIEDMNVESDKLQKQYTVGITTLLKELCKKVNQFPPSLSEKDAHARAAKIAFHYMQHIFKDNLKINPELPPMVFPFHKNRMGQFVWDVNMSVLLNFNNNINDFDLDLSSNLIFKGPTLFLSAENSVIDVYKDEKLLSKHFPNFQIIVGKNVFHHYHREKPDEYIDHVAKFIGVESS